LIFDKIICNINETEFKNLGQNLHKTYNNIKHHLDIFINNEKLENENKKIFENTEANKRSLTQKIYFDPDNEIVLVKRCENGRFKQKLYHIYNKNELDIKPITIKTATEFNNIINDNKYTFTKLKLKTTSIYNITEFNSLPDNKLNIYRDDRMYGDSISYDSYKVDKDGWGNHIYNELSYINKSLNKHIGIDFNKTINRGKNNLLTKVLNKLLKKNINPTMFRKNNFFTEEEKQKEADKKAEKIRIKQAAEEAEEEAEAEAERVRIQQEEAVAEAEELEFNKKSS